MSSDTRVAVVPCLPSDLGQSVANVVVLRGRLARPVEERFSATGERFASFDVSVPPHHNVGRAESVNVVWPDPPTAAAHLRVDDEVLVIGRVRRRFFRVGGVTQSRTEVVAVGACPTRRSKAAAALLADAVGRLSGLQVP